MQTDASTAREGGSKGRGHSIAANAPAIALLVLLVAGWMHFVQPPPSARPRGPQVPTDAQDFSTPAILGARDATVGILEFSEFQCSFCAAFALTTLPRLAREYIEPGRVALAFRHFPLTSIHSHALRAAEVASCAARQTRFASFHDKMFAAQSLLDDGLPITLAEDTGLAMPALRLCLTEQASADVQRDVRLGQSLGVVSTPTFFLGRIHDGRLVASRVIVGARPYEEFASAIDRLLTSE